MALKEVKDYYAGRVGLYGDGRRRSHSEMQRDNSGDMAANRHGAACKLGENCAERCASYVPVSSRVFLKNYIRSGAVKTKSKRLVFSVAKVVAIPEDASSIHVRSNAEAGLYYISYDTNYSMRYINENGMLKIGKGLAPLIRDSLGFAANLPPNIALYYKCNSPSAPLQDVRKNSHEIIMMGSDGQRQYLWNRRNDEELEAVLCRPVGNG